MRNQRVADLSLALVRVAAAALCVRAVWMLSASPADDAFIHLRIARNLAFSGEPFFNPGERVLGTSSPLWMTLLAAAFGASGEATLQHARALACVSVVGVMATSEALVRSTSRRTVGVIAGIACALLAAPSAALAMETPLAVALLCASGWALSTQRYALGGVAMGFAAATRFELFVAAALALMVVPTLRARIRFAAGFLPVAGVEAVLLLAFYGTLIPNTMKAKAIVYPLDWSLFALQEGVAGRGAWLLAAAVAVFAGALALRRSDGRGTGPIMLGGLVSAVLATWVCRLAMIYPWYWALVTVPLAAAAAGVAFEHARGAPEPGRTWVRRAARLAALTAAVALLPRVADATADVVRGARGDLAHVESLVPNMRILSYLEIGSEISAACPDAVVMTSEIGALGWAFPGRVIDGVGLVSPEVLRYHPLKTGAERINATYGAIPALAVVDLRPDVVVAMETFATDLVWNRTNHPGLSEYVLSAAVPVFHPAIPWPMPDELWGARKDIVLRRAASVRCSGLGRLGRSFRE